MISELSSSVIKLLCLKGTSKREIFDKLLDVYGESVFSSPEHEVLMVSYCDQSMSVVRRASFVVNNLF